MHACAQMLIHPIDGSRTRMSEFAQRRVFFSSKFVQNELRLKRKCMLLGTCVHNRDTAKIFLAVGDPFHFATWLLRVISVCSHTVKFALNSDTDIFAQHVDHNGMTTNHSDHNTPMALCVCFCACVVL